MIRFCIAFGIIPEYAMPDNDLGNIEPGDRVLVAWVQSEAVVVDIIKKS